MEDFERSLPMMLYRTLDAVMPDFRALFAAFDITEQQWRVLRALWASDQQSAQALATQTLISPPSLVGVIDRLERRGLLVRARASDDRRVVRVGLTSAGRRLQEEVAPKVEALYEGLRGKLSEQEWDQLYAQLDKLTRAQF